MFCKNCGQQIADSSKFCDKCGTAQTSGATTAATTASAAKFSKDVRDNDYVKIMKLFFISPNKAITKAVASPGTTVGLIFSSISLASTIIFALLVSERLSSGLGLSGSGKLIGFGIVAAIFFTAIGIVLPSVAAFAGAYFNKKDIPFTACFNANSVGMVPVTLVIFISGVCSFISPKIALFMISMAIFAKVFISITTVNQLSKNLFSSPTAFWGSTGIAFGIKLVEYLIIWSIFKNTLEDIIEQLIWSLF